VATTWRVMGCPGSSRTRLILFLLMAAVAIPDRSAEGQRDPRCMTEILDYRRADAATVGAKRKLMIDCVNREDSIAVAVSLKATEPEAMRLTKLFFEIPEYHDEGRLPAGRDARGEVLGPPAAIYASPFLNGFTRPAQINEQGNPGMLAAIVVVDPDGTDTIPDTYKSLHLQRGLNCIWLFARSLTSHTDYHATVSHPANAACDHQGAMSAKLEVVAVRGGRLDAAGNKSAFQAHGDYPPVARFDTDASGVHPVLGFKCLDAFCEIGLPENRVRKPMLLASATDRPVHWRVETRDASLPEIDQRVRVIKGWHDEQNLAWRDNNSIWRPSGVWARITPDPRASTYDSSSFFKQWLRVATITLRGDPPGQTSYAKWGLRDGENRVLLQQDGSMHWKVKIIRAAGDSVIWVNTVRTVHHDAAVPATARFRWTGIDEGIWIPCGNACCRSDGEGGT
jgi:hypothetical protein